MNAVLRKSIRDLAREITRNISTCDRLDKSEELFDLVKCALPGACESCVRVCVAVAIDLLQQPYQIENLIEASKVDSFPSGIVNRYSGLIRLSEISQEIVLSFLNDLVREVPVELEEGLVFLVIKGTYEDASTVAVFSTLEKANNLKNRLNEKRHYRNDKVRVETFPVDVLRHDRQHYQEDLQ